MNVVRTPLHDVLILEPHVWQDVRGAFWESFNEQAFRDLGISARFVQDNHSHSAFNVLRGLHYQVKHAQAKLVRVTAGAVFDVAVDLRRSSPDFGKWFGAELTAENRRMMWIPGGFAHGFLVTSGPADFLYKTSDFYYPEHERTVRWDDPDLGIHWPIGDAREVKLSSKDAAGVSFRDAEVYS